MAANERVNIDIEARNRASGAINQVKQSLGGLESAAGVATKGLAGLAGAFTAGAVLKIAGDVGSAVVEMGRLAEQSRIVGASFEQLAGQAGASASGILAALKRASAGTISEYNLMLASNKALMLGVADSADEMQALMLVAGQRGRAMGLTMEQSFDNLVTGLGRGSVAILDNLGFSMGAMREAQEKAAAAVGKTVDELSDAERKAALLNVVMQEAAGIDLDNVAEMTSDFERAQAAIADLKVAMGEFVVGPLGDAIARATDLLTLLSQGRDALTPERQSSALDRSLADINSNTARNLERWLAQARAAEEYLPGLTARVEKLASAFLLVGGDYKLDQFPELLQAHNFGMLSDLESLIDSLPVKIDALKGPLAAMRENIAMSVVPSDAQAGWYEQVSGLLSFIKSEIEKVQAGAGSSESFYVTTITALKDAAAVAGPAVQALAYEALQLDAAVQSGALSAAEAQTQFMAMIPAIGALQQEAAATAEAMAQMERMARANATSIVQTSSAANNFAATLGMLMGNAFGAAGGMGNLDAVTQGAATALWEADRAARAGASSILALDTAAANAIGSVAGLGAAAFGAMGNLFGLADAAIAAGKAVDIALNKAAGAQARINTVTGALGGASRGGTSPVVTASREITNLAGAYYGARKESDRLQEKTMYLGPALKSAGGGAGALASGLNQIDQAARNVYNTLSGKVSGVLSGALNLDVGVNPEDFLPREDAVNENARRLADIMVNGFKGQDWLGEFAAEAPNVYEALLTAGDPKQAAAQMLRDFQAGLVPELIDKEAVKEAVKRSILGENTMAQLAQEITGELVGEMGSDPAATADLVNQAMGRKVAGSGDMTQQVVGALKASTFLSNVEGAAATAADKWANGFVARVSSNDLPGNILSILGNLVTPYVQANLRAQGTLTGAQ